MKKVLSLLLVMVVLSVTLISCGGSSSIEGTWESAYGELLDDKGVSVMKIKAVGEMKFELQKGGKVVGYAGGQKQGEGTWKQDGNKIIVTEDGNSITLILDKDVLYLEESQTRLYFTKDIKNFKFPEGVMDIPE